MEKWELTQNEIGTTLAAVPAERLSDDWVESIGQISQLLDRQYRAIATAAGEKARRDLAREALDRIEACGDCSVIASVWLDIHDWLKERGL